MPAYAIFCLQELSDPAGLAAYRAAGRQALDGHDAKFLAGPNIFKTLEGAALNAVTLLEFPTAEAAEAWYRSEPYQAIIGLRQAASTSLAFIVEGR